MDSRVKDLVGLAISDKPRAAAQVFSDIILDKVSQKVEFAKDYVANSMVGQEFEPDVEVPEMEDDIETEEDSYEDSQDELGDDVDDSDDEDNN